MHTFCIKAILPAKINKDELLYTDNALRPDALHIGGFLNSLYIYQVSSLTSCESFSISGKCEKEARVTVLLHTEKGKTRSLITEDISANQEFSISIPSLESKKGDRLSTALTPLKAGNSLTQEHISFFHWNAYSVAKPKKVKLALVFCTFNNEELITNNVDLLTQSDFWNNSDTELIIVNNGGETSPLEFNQARVTQFKQKNTGGAGGFTRGIKEAVYASMKELDFTHILLMDDDVKFHPEIIERLIEHHRFSLADNVYGASMLRLENPTYLHEAGAIFKSKKSVGAKSGVTKGIISYKKLNQIGATKPVHYNAWWFCSFSTQAVQKVGLPLQVFIHGDDIEYGIRLRHHGFNNYNLAGLSLWHASFENKPLTWIRYFDVRNAIIRFHSQKGDLKINPEKAAKALVKRVVKLSIMRNDYGAAALTIRAYKDLKENNNDYAIKCYTSKIKALNEEYNSYSSVDEDLNLKHLKHIADNNKPLNLFTTPIMWCRYFYLNFTTLPLSTKKVFTTKQMRYSWWKVPTMSHVLVHTEDGNNTYFLRDSTLNKKLLKELRNTIK